MFTSTQLLSLPEKLAKPNFRFHRQGNHLTAQTTLPQLVVLDSVYFIDSPGTIGDSLAHSKVILPDPPGIPEFYRYFTSTDGGTLRRSDLSVVYDRLLTAKPPSSPQRGRKPTALVSIFPPTASSDAAIR